MPKHIDYTFINRKIKRDETNPITCNKQLLNHIILDKKN